MTLFVRSNHSFRTVFFIKHTPPSGRSSVNFYPSFWTFSVKPTPPGLFFCQAFPSWWTVFCQTYPSFLTVFCQTYPSFWTVFCQTYPSFWTVFCQTYPSFWTVFCQIYPSFWTVFCRIYPSFWTVFLVKPTTPEEPFFVLSNPPLLSCLLCQTSL